MLLAATDYVRPDTLADAVAALAGTESARPAGRGSEPENSSKRVYELLRSASLGAPRGVEVTSR
jgi:hypothetical protein